MPSGVRRRDGAYPIALNADAANAQHYELPPAFFALILGPRRKYSCCLYDGRRHLAEAEERALAETAAHAGLADGQRILELGCGWGSLTLWMAERLSRARRSSRSPIRTRSGHIEAEAKRARPCATLRVMTADMNEFEPDGRFDRVVSVEMFEHMSNWPALLRASTAGWRPDGHAVPARVQPSRACPIVSITPTRPTGSRSISSPAASCRATG